MKALVVTIKIKEGYRDAFVDELLLDAQGSVENEPGCVMFNVVQDDNDPNCVHLYEVYKDSASIEAHRQMPHYVKWRNIVSDWFDGPPIIRSGTAIFPGDIG